MNEQVVKRLRYLRNWELANVVLVPITVIFLFATGVFSWQGFTLWSKLALGLVSFLLLQGTYYWHLKLESIEARKRYLPPSFGRTFLILKWLNVLLLIAYPVVSFGIIRPEKNAFWWSFWLYIFAVLEYINYFEFQLMHDTANDWNYLLKHRRLRRAPLAADLRMTLAKANAKLHFYRK